MKPWEETWRAEIWTHDVGDPIWAIWTDAPREVVSVGVPFAEFDRNEPERAKLAAAAPEMARLLLELQWSGSSEGIRSEFLPRCPVCSGHRDNPFTGASGWEGGHKSDCRLAEVLRKAGVLPTDT